jgi:hypothetical protein
MKRIIRAAGNAAALLLGGAATLAQAHPGVHHLNGVGHSIPFADEITVAALVVWAAAMAGLFAKLYFKHRRGRD